MSGVRSGSRVLLFFSNGGRDVGGGALLVRFEVSLIELHLLGGGGGCRFFGVPCGVFDADADCL